MGNQGYSHDATRVACEILWSGEIGEVREVHAWTGAPGWPQEMQKIPPPTPVPGTLDWDLWLGGAAWRPYTAGDEEYADFWARLPSTTNRSFYGTTSKGEFSNNKDANKWVKPSFRKGWEIKL